MPSAYFPLRWESTGDQWWYASPIDCAAANGQYELVRELLRLDANHLIKLTSLRRTRRLEAAWDDEEQFHDVAKCRSEVAKKLHHECGINKNGKNSLIQGGYGGWLLYTASSAGDLGFVQELLEKEPLLVFGEGEYGVTDIFYAAARSKNSAVFRLIFDFAMSPRFSAEKSRDYEGHFGEIPDVYKWEMMNRAVHAAARGGNLEMLKELLNDCSDVLAAYRDNQGSTILHAAAGRGQVKVVKDVINSFDIVNSVDNQGNTALHIAAYRGEVSTVEALVLASPLSISLKNNAGETFLHMTVSGFQNPVFRRLDKQVELMKKLVSQKIFNLEDIINLKNNHGRTALHTAIIGNIHSDIIQLLMTVRYIDVNVRDINVMTPLDILKQRPRSASVDLLSTQLISAGGIFGNQDYTARKSMVSSMKMQVNGTSPGTSFRINDSEIFLYTGIEIKSNQSSRHVSGGRSIDSMEFTQFSATNEIQSNNMNNIPLENKRKNGVNLNYAKKHLKRFFDWHNRVKEKKSPEKFNNSMEQVEFEKTSMNLSNSEENVIPLRQRFSKGSSSVPNNKPTLSGRNSNLPNPVIAKKRFASGLKSSVMQAMPQLRKTPSRSRSSSLFSKAMVSSLMEIENDNAESNQILDDGIPNFVQKHESLNRRRLVNQYLCFKQSGKDDPVTSIHQDHSYKQYAISAA